MGWYVRRIKFYAESQMSVLATVAIGTLAVFTLGLMIYLSM